MFKALYNLLGSPIEFIAQLYARNVSLFVRYFLLFSWLANFKEHLLN